MADRGLSDLLSTASSLMNSSQTHSSNASHGVGHAPKPSSSEQGNAKPSSSSHSQKPSYGEILSSAQMVMNAAKTKLQKPSSGTSSSSEEVNMGKLAGAAGTLVGAVSHYGKLEESGYGKYAHKAQEYLQTYEIKHSKPGTTAPTAPPQASAYYATSEQQGNSHGHSTYTSASAASYSQQPSAPPQGYSAGYPPAGYPPAGYPDAQQSYGYGQQSYSKPTHPYTDADNQPPIGYPPAGYPTSGGGYNRPSK